MTKGNWCEFVELFFTNQFLSIFIFIKIIMLASSWMLNKKKMISNLVWNGYVYLTSVKWVHGRVIALYSNCQTEKENDDINVCVLTGM